VTTTVDLNDAQRLSSHLRSLHEQGTITPCDLVHGRVTLRRGLLCTVDQRGRLILSAPQKADVARAANVAAIMRGLADSADRRDLGEGQVVGFADEEEAG